MISETQAIIQNLQYSKLLVDDLPDVPSFDRALLSNICDDLLINFDQKLGHLYEDAIESLIKNSKSLELIASHNQIFDDEKNTIGELDFIILDKAKNQHIHLELAVKFYLGIDTKKGWQLPGPDQRDNWYRKIERLQNHQLTLSNRQEAKNILKNEYGISDINPQQLIYGCLFSPMACDAMPYPEEVSQQSRHGKWLYCHEWHDYFDDDPKLYFIPKHLWPVDINDSTRALFLDVHIDGLKALAKDRSIMFCLAEDNIPRFLVPDQWGQNL